MQRGTTVADRELPVKLRDDEMLDRAHTLAQKVAYREGLVESKKSDAKKWQDQIDEADEEIARLARVINDGFENRSQMDLRFDQLPKDQAAQRLAEIAVIAAKHPFVPSEAAIDTCAKDGCGAAAVADVHVAPLPSQPHTFAPDGKGEGKCWACGSGADDPVHAEPKAAPEPTVAHAFMADAGAEGVCSLCGGPESSLVHNADAIDVAGHEEEVDELATDIAAATTAADRGWAAHPFKAVGGKGLAGQVCEVCGAGPTDPIHAVTTVEPTPEESTAALERAAASGDPAAADDFDPALDEVETPAESGRAGD